VGCRCQGRLRYPGIHVCVYTYTYVYIGGAFIYTYVSIGGEYICIHIYICIYWQYIYIYIPMYIRLRHKFVLICETAWIFSLLLDMTGVSLTS
jgi:hypothetical protein